MAASATIGAQSGLSVFVSTTAILLILLLIVPATRNYFGLTAPDPSVVAVPAIALAACLVRDRESLRFRVLERALGLLR